MPLRHPSQTPTKLRHGDRFWLALDRHANGDKPASAFLVQWQQAEPKFEGLPRTSALDARWQSVVDPLQASAALGLLLADVVADLVSIDDCWIFQLNHPAAIVHNAFVAH